MWSAAPDRPVRERRAPTKSCDSETRAHRGPRPGFRVYMQYLHRSRRVAIAVRRARLHRVRLHGQPGRHGVPGRADARVVQRRQPEPRRRLGGGGGVGGEEGPEGGGVAEEGGGGARGRVVAEQLPWPPGREGCGGARPACGAQAPRRDDEDLRPAASEHLPPRPPRHRGAFSGAEALRLLRMRCG